MWIFKSRLPGSYFDPYYKNLVQFKHACLNDYVLQGSVVTSLKKCNCGYYQKFHLPCWHMYRIGLENGIYDDLFKNGMFLAERFDKLSEREKNAFSKILYLGYYDCDQANVIPKAYIKPFLKAGVFEEIGGKYFYPKELRDNIFFTIYYFMYK